MKRKILIINLILLSLPFALQAQNQIKNSVVANGATDATDGSVRIRGTIGQAAIGLNSGFWVQSIDLVTHVEKQENELLPSEYKLHQNYPNPFNPTTTIQFDIPEQTFVKLKIFNVLGKELDTLLDEEMTPGVYKLQFEAAELPSGIYFYRIETEQFVQTKKLMLIK